MKQDKTRNILWAVLAAALYAVSSPVSKVLLASVPPTMMAAFLYLGAGTGMLVLGGVRKAVGQTGGEHHLTRKDLPYTVGMIVLDMAAPILLMLGLAKTTSANVALLNNFEIVSTSVVALIVFQEKIGKRLWAAVGLITVSSVVLSVEDAASFQFSIGSVFVMLACVCWGFENNCTRMMAGSDPLEIVVVKGVASGLGSLAIALLVGEPVPGLRLIAAVLLLGFFAYGLSIFFYVHAQRGLGAAKTSAFYAIAPFIGVGLSLLIFRERPGAHFFIALVIMIAGAYLASTDAVQKE